MHVLLTPADPHRDRPEPLTTHPPLVTAATGPRPRHGAHTPLSQPGVRIQPSRTSRPPPPTPGTPATTHTAATAHTRPRPPARTRHDDAVLHSTSRPTGEPGHLHPVNDTALPGPSRNAPPRPAPRLRHRPPPHHRQAAHPGPPTAPPHSPSRPGNHRVTPAPARPLCLPQTGNDNPRPPSGPRGPATAARPHTDRHHTPTPRPTPTLSACSISPVLGDVGA